MRRGKQQERRSALTLAPAISNIVRTESPSRVVEFDLLAEFSLDDRRLALEGDLERLFLDLDDEVASLGAGGNRDRDSHVLERLLPLVRQRCAPEEGSARGGELGRGGGETDRPARPSPSLRWQHRALFAPPHSAQARSWSPELDASLPPWSWPRADTCRKTKSSENVPKMKSRRNSEKMEYRLSSSSLLLLSSDSPTSSSHPRPGSATSLPRPPKALLASLSAMPMLACLRPLRCSCSLRLSTNLFRVPTALPFQTWTCPRRCRPRMYAPPSSRRFYLARIPHPHLTL